MCQAVKTLASQADGQSSKEGVLSNHKKCLGQMWTKHRERMVLVGHFNLTLLKEDYHV